jgi:glycosyltransferase involved in cell wall biosynthesis
MKAMALARNEYDLIVCGHLALAPVAAAIRFVYRTPFWLACYGTDVWGPQPLLKRIALRRSDLLLPISRFTAKKLSEVHKIPQERVFILHTTIPNDFERLLTAPAGAGGSEASVLNRERILLSVGSLARALAYKGFDTVIRALPGALERVPNLRYVIVGDGDDRPRLEKLTAEHKLERHVTFAGSVSDEELAKYYRSCDLFVLPSKATARKARWEGEGFGRVYVEAALAGKPAVGSNSGGAAEAVIDGKTGFLVDPSCGEELTRALLTLLQNPDLSARMGRAGREWALENFTQQSLEGSLLELLGPRLSRGKS